MAWRSLQSLLRTVRCEPIYDEKAVIGTKINHSVQLRVGPSSAAHLERQSSEITTTGEAGHSGCMFVMSTNGMVEAFVIDRLLNNAIIAVIPQREHACAATQGFC